MNGLGAALRAPLVGAMLVLAAGCAATDVVEEGPFDPDGRSGPDRLRKGALPMELDTVYVDRVSFGGGDRTDWKYVDVPKAPGQLQFELKPADGAAELLLSIFDAQGVRLMDVPADPSTVERRATLPVVQPAPYFLRIRTPDVKQDGRYEVKVAWASEKSEGGGGDKGSDTRADRTPTGPRQDNKVRRRDDSTLEGRIVESHRTKAGLRVFLDKGRAAGLVPGQSGWVLEGPSGRTQLVGGQFKITEVVDEARSIAVVSLNSLGRNVRFVVETR